MKLLPALALALGLFASPAAAAEVAATATYGVTLGGTNVATVTIRFTDTGSHYAMALTARIAGLAQLVASGTAKGESVGVSTGSGLVSEKFDLLTRAQGSDFTVNVEYAGKEVTAFIVDPPILNNIDRVALERKHLRGVNDMLAAFVLKGGRLGAGLCDRKLQIFTGTERFNVALRFARGDEATSKRTGYQGPLVACAARYTPISGHYTTSEITTYLAESDKILIWHPYQAALAGRDIYYDQRHRHALHPEAQAGRTRHRAIGGADAAEVADVDAPVPVDDAVAHSAQRAPR